MYSISSNTRIFLYTSPVDMRNSFEGLSFVIEENFSAKIISGTFFAFLNRKRDKMKILYWDIDGLAIWYKRLEKGRFLFPQKSELNRREFLMLLEGITPKKLQKRYAIF